MSLRRALRHPVRTAARLGLKIGEVPVTVTDISVGGARLALAPSITSVAVGDRLTIEVAGASIRAEVRWRLGQQAGVAFDAPIPAELYARINADSGCTAQAKRRPGRKGAPAPTIATS